MNSYTELLRNNNLKATPKRLGVLEILCQNSQYLSASEIHEKIRKKLKRSGLPTIYRILEEFEKLNIISRYESPDNIKYYFHCENKEHHHHFFCRNCHKVQCLDICIYDEVRQLAANKLGAKAESHLLQVVGLCKECSNWF